MAGSAAKVVITERQQEVLCKLSTSSTAAKRLTQRADIILLAFSDLDNETIAGRVGLERHQVGQWRRRWQHAFEQLIVIECMETGAALRRAIEHLLSDEPRVGRPLTYAPCGSDKPGNEEKIKEAIFALLHSPPFDHGINRTSWRIKDLHDRLRQQGVNVCQHTISRLVRDSGFRWRNAVEVLTSRDPKYKEKLEKLHSVLSTLGPNERFFSIDEYGPFSIGMKGGRKLEGPGERRHIPIGQTYKGVLIVTAALELSTNQVTHFYSGTKNTEEMIKLAHILLGQYAKCDKLYLSWDAASWHTSKALYIAVNQVNDAEYRKQHKTPPIELVPLPSGAQFLNVIESVFSGLARAVVHNSDYQSEGEAKAAIDRHFEERNQHFLKNPKSSSFPR